MAQSWFSVDITMPPINKYISRLGGIVGKANVMRANMEVTREMAQELKQRFEAVTPVYDQSMGGMGGPHARDMWEVHQVAADTWAIENRSPKINWLLDGAPPPEDHRISANHPANALHFFWKGSEWYRESVRRTRTSKPNEAMRNVAKEAAKKPIFDVEYLRQRIRDSL